jgi:hypothetical protein
MRQPLVSLLRFRDSQMIDMECDWNDESGANLFRIEPPSAKNTAELCTWFLAGYMTLAG